MRDASSLWRSLHELAADPGERLDIDLGGVSVIDGASMSLVVELRAELAARGVRCEIVGGSEHVRALVHLYGGDEPPRPRSAPQPNGAIAGVGRATARALSSVSRALVFVGTMIDSLAAAVRRRGLMNWRALPRLAERAGADGIAIVALLNFLVGFIMAFQTARALELYGANIYVADVVGISITRELSPLVTAVIVSGRSGAAYAAEIGTMRVSEEIDALRTMGFAPAPYLVFPRVLALGLVSPGLTLLGDVVGVFGGAVVGRSSLGVSPLGYLAELRRAVVFSDVWTGLVKSVVFGIAIALIGSQQGFATQGAAAGVGRATTATVVLCFFMIVIVDTLMTVIFRSFGL